MPKEKILIADDEPDILSLCKRVIGRKGYDVTGVSDGLEAIEVARQERFDLFLTDIMMPRVGGLDAAQAIREFQPHLVCVVMTGFGTMDTAIRALQLGFTEFVVKPFNAQDIMQAVNRALEKERLRSENERLRALVPLFELNKTLMTTVEEDELVDKVLHTACDELGTDLGVLMLRDTNQNLSVRAGFGLDQLVEPEGVEDFVVAIARDLLEARQQVLVQSPEGANPPVQDVMRTMNVECVMFNPLVAMDTVVGALLLAKSEPGARFAQGDGELLSVLCGQAAIALYNARLFEEIQRAYQDLQELDHMKSEFVNIAAHELRTPLAILMGHADLLAEDTEDPEIRNRLQIIVRNALRLRSLIQDLLDMRHLQTGEHRVKLADVDVQDLVLTALQDFHLMAEKKGVRISANVPPDLPPIQTDREKVLIAFSNLVKNAIEFTPAGGRVGVEVCNKPGELRVSVSDTGIGIAEKQYERVFRPFYQVESSLTREHEGMGVGLSIAKGMVELCGGRIWVESAVGKGSRFSFAIPKR